MSVLLELSMFPTDKGESVSAYVSEVIRLLRDSGARYQLTAMGTVVESDDLQQALELVQRCYQVLDDAGCKRVYASLKLDIRKGRGDRLQGKVDTVRSRIGEIST